MIIIKNRKIVSAVTSILILSPICVYLLIAVISNFDIQSHFGTVSDWIGFAGSIISGTITMVALYFTISYQNKKSEENYINQIRPTIIVELDEKNNIFFKDCFDDKNYVFWKIENISKNIANEIKILKDYNIVN